MYTERNGKQIRMEMVTLEELVPENHLLRKIDKAIDFSFINRICKGDVFKCETGKKELAPSRLGRLQGYGLCIYPYG